MHDKCRFGLIKSGHLGQPDTTACHMPRVPLSQWKIFHFSPFLSLSLVPASRSSPFVSFCSSSLSLELWRKNSRCAIRLSCSRQLLISLFMPVISSRNSQPSAGVFLRRSWAFAVSSLLAQVFRMMRRWRNFSIDSPYQPLSSRLVSNLHLSLIGQLLVKLIAWNASANRLLSVVFSIYCFWFVEYLFSSLLVFASLVDWQCALQDIWFGVYCFFHSCCPSSACGLVNIISSVCSALQKKSGVPGLENILVNCLERVFRTKYGASFIPHYMVCSLSRHLR